MSRVIDGILKDWGDRLDWGYAYGRKCRNIRHGSVEMARPVRVSRPMAGLKIALTVKKAPEVMVKISGGGKNMRQIKAHMDYISRNGTVELEDENGQTYMGKEDVMDVRDAWGKGRIGIPNEGGTRKEAFNIILSMPAGTDRQAVKDAARAFASQEFEQHQYVFAAHDDEKHPHVHLAVKAVGRDGVRLNPRKSDLQHWREVFAQKMRDQGIEANATPRKARGIVQKPEKQAIRQMERRGAVSTVKTGFHADIECEVQGGQVKQNPAQDKISVTRKAVQHAYGKIARALAQGDRQDKQLALNIVQFVQQMPPPITKHQEMVQQQLREADGYAHKPPRTAQDRLNHVGHREGSPVDERSR